MNQALHTTFGVAKVNHNGYYVISSRKEGNNGKYLHRLIYEKNWGKIPKGYEIHHADGNKLNNCILNLVLMTINQHNKFHYDYGLKKKIKRGKEHPYYGKHLSEEHKKKIGLAQLQSKNHMFGKHHSLETRKKMSASKNKSGYFRVHKESCKKCKQGYTYTYVYVNKKGERKRFKNVDIIKLETIVKEKGLEWFKIE